MAEPTFDHERLDVYRLSIDYVAFSYRIAKSLSGIHRPAREQWLRAAQSIALNIGLETNRIDAHSADPTNRSGKRRSNRVRVRVPRC